MDVKDYCNGLQAELTGWKAKVYDVTRRLDKMSSGDKEKVVPEVNELHMIIEELNDRIEKLQRECPSEYGPDKTELDSKFTAIKSHWEEAWKHVSPGDIGG
ncbi:MAG: hypothetical protein SVY10_03745 [Thermodesulfobacteriota bacterium]|nr:hypothetical protein [Thermodesulfobacteriota bacterium]